MNSEKVFVMWQLWQTNLQSKNFAGFSTQKFTKYILVDFYLIFYFRKDTKRFKIITLRKLCLSQTNKEINIRNNSWDIHLLLKMFVSFSAKNKNRNIRISLYFIQFSIFIWKDLEKICGKLKCVIYINMNEYINIYIISLFFCIWFLFETLTHSLTYLNLRISDFNGIKLTQFVMALYKNGGVALLKLLLILEFWM